VLIKGSGPPSRGDDQKAQRGNLGREKAPLHSSPKPPRQTFAPVDSIQVGTRHRRDLGDFAGLAESITLQYGCALELLRRALLCDAQGRASTPLDATTVESEAMR
jgi:hypothetical protein